MKKMKKFNVMSGLIFAFVLVMFAFQSGNANPVTEQRAVVSSEMGATVVHLNIFDGKCGEGTAKTEKKVQAKGKTTEGKCGEGKCGEGKCGTGTAKAEKKTEAKVKAKSTESKCGTGTSRTEKSSSKKAKTSEGKCGEGKCGIA